jgi:circadian clock protein KaiB
MEGRDEFVGLIYAFRIFFEVAWAGEGRFMSTYVIKLYVTGQTPRSRRAIDNLRRLCEEELQGRYDLVVIDVLERPQLAEDEKILATPTVVKELPLPIRRIIGDLSDSERVLLGLDLHPCGGSTSPSRTL